MDKWEAVAKEEEPAIRDGAGQPADWCTCGFAAALLLFLLLLLMWLMLT